MRLRWPRVVIRAFGLAALGFVCGTVIGVLILYGVDLLYAGRVSLGRLPFALVMSSVFGGLLGAVIAPIAWIPLRRVDLGRVIYTTGGGTVTGGVLTARLAGWIGEPEATYFVMIPGGLVGFVLGAVWLHRRHSPAEETPKLR